MRISPILAAATALTFALRALCFPFMQGEQAGDAAGSIRRGLDAMARDPELVQEIRELYARQRADADQWKREGKRDLIGGLLGGIGGILNQTVGEYLIPVFK
jgi:hypothetical protein